jgi:hypothetical protein
MISVLAGPSHSLTTLGSKKARSGQSDHAFGASGAVGSIEVLDSPPQESHDQ